MKKILLTLISIIFSINICYCEEFVSVDLPYYVKINNEVIRIKKIYDKDNLEVVFNIEPDNYNLSSNFNKYREVNKDNYGLYFRNLDYFNTIVYYGYNQNKSDLNYFLTQVIVWQLVLNKRVKIVNEKGEEIKDYEKEYSKIFNEILNHNSHNDFYNQIYTIDVFSTKTFDFKKNIVLNPVENSGLKFNLYDNYLDVYAKCVGNYEVLLEKTYNQENYSYSDGVNIYWQNLGGPSNINKKFYLNVEGIKLNIIESSEGINSRFGDAKLDSKYELYLDNNLVLEITDLSNIYVQKNQTYTLKNVSDDIGFYDFSDITFNVLEEEYNLNILKNVISKNISFTIKDNYTYEIYLKSNNELYEVVDKNTEIITLPYGTYYIKNDFGYNEELLVNNNSDEYIVIDNLIDREESDKLEEDIIDIEEVVNNEEVIREDTNTNEVVDNPKTFDGILLYVNLTLVATIYLIGVGIYFKKTL